MRQILFLKDFDYRQDDYLTIAYMAGTQAFVEDDCAARAVAKGSAQYADFAEDDLIEGREEDQA
jgi:hypothetical protein